MKGYLLDTHVPIWLMTDNVKLNKNIREDIEYFQNAYYVSVETLREIVILQLNKKIELKIDSVISYLQSLQVCIIDIDTDHIKELEKTPMINIAGKTHEDPFDRMLIAQAITNKLTIISSDGKFPFYKNYGLKLLVNEL